MKVVLLAGGLGTRLGDVTHRIPKGFLRAAVRNGRMLRGRAVTRSTVQDWLRRDEPVLLLRLRNGIVVPARRRRR